MSSPFYSLKALKARVESLIEAQGEDSQCAAWIYTSEDVLKYDDDGDEGGDDSGNDPFGENKGGAPEGGFDGAGRPKEGGNYGTDENPFGRDPLGNKSLSKNERYNATSVINQEQITGIVSRMKSKVKTKEMLRESLKTDTNETPSPLLDEKNILDS